MDRKKLISNLIWVAAVVFLAWYFLWPVSLADAMPEQEDILVSVLATDAAGTNTQTELVLPAGSEAREQLQALLGQYSCYRTINPNNRNTTQGLAWNEKYLIRNESASAAIYTYGTSKILVNDDLLRMGWFNNNQALAFARAIQNLLQQENTGIVLKSTQVISPAGG